MGTRSFHAARSTTTCHYYDSHSAWNPLFETIPAGSSQKSKLRLSPEVATISLRADFFRALLIVAMQQIDRAAYDGAPVQFTGNVVQASLFSCTSVRSTPANCPKLQLHPRTCNLLRMTPWMIQSYHHSFSHLRHN